MAQHVRCFGECKADFLLSQTGALIIRSLKLTGWDGRRKVRVTGKRLEALLVEDPREYTITTKGGVHISRLGTMEACCSGDGSLAMSPVLVPGLRDVQKAAFGTSHVLAKMA